MFKNRYFCHSGKIAQDVSSGASQMGLKRNEKKVDCLSIMSIMNGNGSKTVAALGTLVGLEMVTVTVGLSQRLPLS